MLKDFSYTAENFAEAKLAQDTAEWTSEPKVLKSLRPAVPASPSCRLRFPLATTLRLMGRGSNSSLYRRFTLPKVSFPVMAQ